MLEVHNHSLHAVQGQKVTATTIRDDDDDDEAVTDDNSQHKFNLPNIRKHIYEGETVNRSQMEVKQL
jgi:hypothetical protein